MQRLLALVTLLAGCPFTPPTPTSRVRKGLAATEIVSPLAPLPVVCTDIGQYCNDAQKIALTTQTRMELEFLGYAIIDAETVTAASGEIATDLPLEDQRAILVGMGAKGYLTTHVTFGMPHGMAQQQTVTVGIAITRAYDNALAWSSRCSVETGDHHTAERAIELAARCALEAATLW